jgi:PEP-CTERM motif
VASIAFDPIRGGNPNPITAGAVCWDHATGTNATTSATQQIANCSVANAANRVADYAALLAANNVAQNSWKPHWFIPGFNPNLDGVYTLSLAARDAQTGFFVGATEINIIVGRGAVPLPGSLALAGLGLVVAGAIARSSRRA